MYICQILISFCTCFRFGVAEAIALLLRQPGILVNSKTIQVYFYSLKE